MKAEVLVTLKQEILDPQGEAVRHSLHELGHADVRSVRVGKYIELELDAQIDRNELNLRIESMCKQLLTNAVMEDFRVLALHP